MVLKEGGFPAVVAFEESGSCTRRGQDEKQGERADFYGETGRELEESGQRQTGDGQEGGQVDVIGDRPDGKKISEEDKKWENGEAGRQDKNR